MGLANNQFVPISARDKPAAVPEHSLRLLWIWHMAAIRKRSQRHQKKKSCLALAHAFDLRELQSQ